ncbi:hypothetical protein [Brevibacterium sp. FAM 24630]|jgi:hypothetical protein|uniref:hypothetical protein n=1 Tax=Brevibacterium sp. FAM 24630 TaxID=3415680 RepID=UPI003C7D532D
MATTYEPEQIAAMAAEFGRAAALLDIDLPSDPVELTDCILTASARWSSLSGCRALGPFGAFLAGAADEPAFDHLDRLVAGLTVRD